MKLTRRRIYEIIFEADTPAGKAFDVVLLIAVLLSVIVVILDSVESYNAVIGNELYWIEWFLTILFTIEYFARIYAIHRPWKYIFSFYGIIDLLSILPAYLSLMLAGSHYLAVIRVFRLLRIFRVLKLARYVKAGNALMEALKNSRARITVFFEVVAAIVVLIGSVMYLVEGPENGFDSIPRSIYWAVVTITTVGYGDIAPQTVIGQTLASLLMLTGYAIIAVPTGIITSEAIKTGKYEKPVQTNTQVCRRCGFDRHDDDARFCKMCGYSLDK